MSLSWWGRPAGADAPRRRRGTVLALALAIAVAALSGGLIASTPRAAEETPFELQALLDDHFRAVLERNEHRHALTLDPSSREFITCLEQSFALGERWASYLAPFRLRGTERLSDTLVRGYVELSNGVAVYYFRKLGASWVTSKAPFESTRSSTRWYLSEPRKDEAGELLRRTVGGIRVTYRHVDDRFVTAVAQDVAEALLFGAPRAGLVEDDGPDVVLHLSRAVGYSASSYRCFIDGSVRRDGPRVDLVLYRLVFEATGQRLSASFRQLLRHEALHWAQEQRLAGALRGDWWLVEGWPDAVMQRHDVASLAALLCGRSDVPTASELVRGPTREEWRNPIGRYYPSAASAVEFLIETYGQETYWRLLHASTRQPGYAYVDVLGVDALGFHERWLAWARERHCGIAAIRQRSAPR